MLKAYAQSTKNAPTVRHRMHQQYAKNDPFLEGRNSDWEAVITSEKGPYYGFISIKSSFLVAQCFCNNSGYLA
jgi:hypothetical protein